MIFIRDRLASEGWINRKHLAEAFGISTPQASIDLRRYMELKPGSIVYDATLKRYCINKMDLSANKTQQDGLLREALRIYGGHIPPCRGRPCTCGFQDAWRAAGLPESK